VNPMRAAESGVAGDKTVVRMISSRAPESKLRNRDSKLLAGFTYFCPTDAPKYVL
jgi:hypothetical protein